MGIKSKEKFKTSRKKGIRQKQRELLQVRRQQLWHEGFRSRNDQGGAGLPDGDVIKGRESVIDKVIEEEILGVDISESDSSTGKAPEGQKAVEKVHNLLGGLYFPCVPRIVQKRSFP